MKKMNKLGKSVLLSTLAAIAFGGIAVSTTYALFTSDAKTNVTVTSGKVSVKTEVSEIKLYSLNSETGESEALTSTTTFTNSGTFGFDATTGTIALDRLTPGDKAEFTVKAKNESNVNIKVRTVLKTLFDNGLIDGLVIKVNDEVYDGSTTVSDYVDVAKDAALPKSEYKFSIELPADRGNQYQDKNCSIAFSLEAVQGNAKIEEVDDSTYAIYTSTDLAAFAKKANAKTFTYEKAVLMNDIDMAGIDYASPNLSSNDKLEFDGNGHTIKNFTPTVNNDGNTGGNLFMGLIGWPAKVTNIHNISFEAANVEGTTEIEDPAINAGIVVGYYENHTDGSLTVSDITIKNSSVSKVKYASSILGYTSSSGVKISNIDIEDVELSGYTAGGLIGQVGGGSTVINNVVGKDITVDGYKREGGMVGAVSGSTLDITYDTTKYSATISEEAIADKGSIVGLTGNNTTVNGAHYVTVLNSTALNNLAGLSPDKLNVIEIGAGTYDGSALTSTQGITAGVEIVGRGDKNNIKWIQATESAGGYSFKGSKLTMKNLTITSSANSYYTGFPHTTSSTFENVKVLVDHEGGAMGYWGDGDVVFTNCEFDSTNGEESNMYAYGGKNFTFTACKFTSDETAIKLYQETKTEATDVNVTITDTTFKNVHSVDWTLTKDYKTAIQLDSNSASDMIHYNIVMKNSTVEGNYSAGILTGSYKGLIGVRTKANVKANNATLTIDGVEQNLALAE